MNSAKALVSTFLSSGIDVCFANPGTSEMHFVAALDSQSDMRCVLGLDENTVTGAADGYYRMARDPAVTLLHLAPGLTNGGANLHNARKAQSGIVNVVGDHATWHQRYESPLKGNVRSIAEALSDWTRVSEGSDTLARDAAEAIRAARSGAGQIATLIAPADTAWGKGPGPSVAVAPRPRRRAKIAAIEAAAAALRRPGAGLLIGAEALFGDHLETAGRIAAATGCRLFAHALVARQARGAGCVKVESLSPSIEQNMPLLCDLHTLVLLGALRPVSFFSYPELPSLPEPPGCHVLDLVKPHDDVPHALDALAEATGAGANIEPARWAASRPDAPRGALTPDTIGQAIASTFPEGTILIDESITAGRGFPELFATAAPHDYLRDTGGAIGFAMPLAVGAAIACPGRQVLALTGDGSAMFNLQALWTQARERLDVVNVVFANREYRILLTELKRMGVSQVGRSARFMLEMGNPALDWVAISQGHGVPAQCVDTAEDFHAALTQAFADPGPHLIEVLY